MSQLSGSHLKILGARGVTCGKFQTDDPQTDANVQNNLVTTAIWRSRFVQPWYTPFCSNHTTKDLQLNKQFVEQNFRSY